jgi:hypothetical protein
MPSLPEGPSEADTFIRQQERFRSRSEELLVKARRLADAIQERISRALGDVDREEGGGTPAS